MLTKPLMDCGHLISSHIANNPNLNLTKPISYCSILQNTAIGNGGFVVLQRC